MRAYLLVILLLASTAMTQSKTFVPASHPYIQYTGRWDMTDSLHPRHSWPGTFVTVAFSGTVIGVRMTDGVNYYNVYIDGALYGILHADKQGEAEYLLADSLAEASHVLVLSKRNICFDQVFSVDGFLIDDGAALLPPPARPEKKIEFIGDSFTAAESNEATVQSLPWEERYPVTNIDKGFAPLVARHFGAEFHTTCRSGSGMVCDWQGNRSLSIPALFDRTLMERAEPKWDFKQWVPDLVVIILGFNDQSGLKDTDGNVSPGNSLLFRTEYHKFIEKVRSLYAGVPVFAVAAHPEWIRTNVRQVVEEEIASGQSGIYYAQFDEFPGGYVANGHPTVETHAKIAGQIIKAIENQFPGHR